MFQKLSESQVKVKTVFVETLIRIIIFMKFTRFFFCIAFSLSDL